MDVLGDEIVIHTVLLDEQMSYGQGEGSVRSRPGLDQELRPLCRLRAPRIDHHQLGTPLERLSNEHHLVDVRLRRVLPPQHD